MKIESNNSQSSFQFMCGIIPTVLKVEDTDSWRDRVVNDLSKEDAEKFVLLTVLRWE